MLDFYKFAQTLPEPKLGESWNAYYDQHVRNAERLRAEAFRYALLDVGHGLRRVGQALHRQLTGGGRNRVTPAESPADASHAGAD